MRPEVIGHVAEQVAGIARSIEAVAIELDDEELLPEDRQTIGRSLRIAEREIDLLHRHLRSLFST
jgi:hypothetical protein